MAVFNKYSVLMYVKAYYYVHWLEFKYILYAQEREFKRSCSTQRYHLYNGNQVFVLWEWNWVEDLMEDSSCATSENLSDWSSPQPPASNSPQALLDETSDSDDDSIPAITHTVLFKCMGADKEIIKTLCTWQPRSMTRV